MGASVSVAVKTNFARWLTKYGKNKQQRADALRACSGALMGPNRIWDTLGSTAVAELLSSTAQNMLRRYDKAVDHRITEDVHGNVTIDDQG